MKKLLVLTDFTDNASHAETVAVRLSSKLHTNIVLYHTLPFFPLIPTSNGGPYVSETANVIFEDSKERLVQEVDKLREISVMKQGYQLNIEERSGEGTLNDVIGEASEDPEIKMIIMGGRAGSGLEHLLSGSDTAAVIKKSHKPVYIIPAAIGSDIPQKIVYATDFGATDEQAVEFLIDMAELLNAKLDIVHILQPGEGLADLASEIAFRKFLTHRGLICKQVSADEVSEGLHRYCKENGADLLAMAHGHHSFIAKLFGRSKSQAEITHQQLALLIFPPNFKYTL